MFLLINPPLVKPSEPPPGLARLHATLSAAGVECSVIDANIEGILYLLRKEVPRQDRWTVRAARNRQANLEALRKQAIYRDLQHYRRAVFDLNRILSLGAGEEGHHLSLSNFGSSELSPVRSRDLLRAAEEYEKNPFHEYFSLRLADAITLKSPEFIGLSLNFLSQALTAFSMMGYIRNRFPGLRIVLGGGLVTSWVRNRYWKNPFAGLVDALVDGPGESHIAALAGKVAPRSIKPDYSDFPMENYLAPGPILPFSTSSGCYWNRCAFCPETAEGTQYRPMPPAQAIPQLQVLTREMRPALIHLLDSALSPALLKNLIQNPPGTPWYGFVRITRSLADADFCRSLRRSGCVMLKLGLESGAQDVIDSEGKGIDLGTASKALQSLKEAGIGTYIHLLFGTPSESEKEARETLNFVARHSSWIDCLNLAIFNMPVNSPDAAKYGTEPHYSGDLSLYTGFSHPKGWNRNDVRQFLDKEFKRHPLIAPIITRDPPFFTSNHAPFFSRVTE